MKWLTIGMLALCLMTNVPVMGQQELPTLASIQNLLDSGRTDDALSQLNQRIEADINDVQSRFLKGLALMEQGDNGGAREVYVEIARLFPQLPESFNNLAAIYVQEGELEKARMALQTAKANAPDYPLVHINLGDLYLKLAADAYREALTLDPDDQAAAVKLQALHQLVGAGG